MRDGHLILAVKKEESSGKDCTGAGVISKADVQIRQLRIAVQSAAGHGLAHFVLDDKTQWKWRHRPDGFGAGTGRV